MYENLDFGVTWSGRILPTSGKNKECSWLQARGTVMASSKQTCCSSVFRRASISPMVKVFWKTPNNQFPFWRLISWNYLCTSTPFPLQISFACKNQHFFFLVLKLKNFLETNRVRNIEEDLLSPGVNLSQSHLKGSWTYFCAFS